MALSTTEQLDYLWKKIGYGVTKTDTASTKQAYNESIASPLLLRADKLWTQAGEIPGVKPTTTSSIVRVYKDGTGSWSSTVKCTEDLTATDNRTWKTNLTDWIPPEFGSTYLVTVYIDNDNSTSPQTTGTQLYAAGASASSNDEWFFDYQSGVLHFIGTNLPTDIASGVTGKSIFISGARYIGTFGISGSVSSTSADLGNIHVEQNTISSTNTNGNIIIDPNGTGVTNVIGNLNVSGTSNLGPTSNVVITGGTNGQFLQTNGSGSLTWATVDSFKIANGTAEVYTYLNSNVGISAGGTSNVVVVTSTGATLSGTLTAGNVTATNDVVIGGNLTVSGTTEYINVTSTVIKDPIIELGGGANAAALTTNDTKDRGTLLHYFTTKAVDAFMGWDNSAGEFAFGSNVSVSDNIVTFNTLGNIKAGNANLGNAVVANYFVGNGSQLTGVESLSVGVSTVSYKLANGTSNVNIPVVDGNVTFGVSGNSNVVVVTGTGINIAGTLNTGAYTANFGNAGVTNTLLVGNIVTGSGSGGNITGADYITANILQGVLTSGTSNVNIRSSGGNVTLSVGGTANVLTATTTGINLLYSTTSVANLGNLVTANYVSVSGNISTTGIKTDNYYYANGVALDMQQPAGADSQLQYNDNNDFGASSKLTFNKTTNVFTVTGNLISSNASLGNLATANYVTVSSNLTSGNASLGNLATANYVTVSSNLTSGNASLGNLATANYVTVSSNLTSGNASLGNLATANYVTVSSNLTSGNASLGNLATANYVSVTANVTSGNANLGNLATANYFSGNGYFLTGIGSASRISNGTSNVDITSSGGNITVGVNGTSSVVTISATGINLLYTSTSTANLGNSVTANYATIAGNLTSGNANLGNLASANYITVNSNLTASNANVTSTLKAKDVDVTGNATIAGNLTVNGNFTYVQSTVTYVTDPITEQGGANNAGALTSNDNKDRGILLHYYTTKVVDAFMGWDNSNGEFALGSNVSVTDNIVTFNTFGNIRVGNAVLGNLATANYVTVSSNLTSGNASLGNLATANYLSVTANLTSGNASLGNLATANYVTVSSNITSGNANLGNAVTANYFLGNGSLLTGVAASSATTIQVTEQFSGTYYPVLANSYNNNTYALGSNSAISFDISQGALTVTSLNGVINTAEQTNITKVGNLQSLQVGNATSGGNVNLFDDGSVIATGNITADYYFGNGALLTGILDAGQALVSLQSNVHQATTGSTYYLNFTNDVSGNLQLQANSNLTYSVSNDTLSAGLLQGVLTTGAQPNITSLGTLTQLNVTGNSNVGVINASGNITAPYYFGNGSLLTGVATSTSANISFSSNIVQANTGLYYIHFGSGTSGSQSIAANENLLFDATRGELIANLFTGTLTTAYQNNITSLGQLIGLNVAGDATISGTLTAGSLTGTLTTASQPAITEVGTLGNLNVTGNIVAGNVIADNVYGLVKTASQPYITSLGTLTSLDVSGNITAGNIDVGDINGGNLISANYFAGNGVLLTNLTGSNVIGSVTSALRAGTVTTNAQPNITSVGTLTSLRVTGNTNVGSILTDNIKYANGDPYIFNVSANGSTGDIQFNDNNQFTGNSNFTYNKTTRTLSVPNISATTSNTVALNVSGNANFTSLSSVKITGGLPDYVIKTDGSGNLSWVQVDTNQVFTGASYVSIARDLFTVADSVTSQVTLSMTPSSKSAIQVNIDGIIQISSTYNLTNNVLDFDEYLLEGSQVEVTMYGIIDATGSDNQIQYYNSGTFDSSANLTFDPSNNTLTANKVNVTDGPLTINGSTISVTNGVSAGIFNLGTPNITIGATSSNVTIGSSSGNTILKGTVLATEFASNRVKVAISSTTQIDSFPVSKYRTAKYIVSAESDIGYQSLEVLLIHDGSESYITTYGAIGTLTDDDIVTLSSNVVSGYVCLYATDIYPNTSINLLCTYVKI